MNQTIIENIALSLIGLSVLWIAGYITDASHFDDVFDEPNEVESEEEVQELDYKKGKK